jgi:hypothetical protein
LTRARFTPRRTPTTRTTSLRAGRSHGRTFRLVIPALAVAEATYFVGRRLGAGAEGAFLRGLGELDVEGPSREDFTRMAELVEEHSLR